MSDPTVIAWLDLETTDSDENSPYAAIIEVGVVFTDFELDPIMSTQLVVNPGLDENLSAIVDPLDFLWKNMKPVVQEMHTANGLWEDVAKSEYSTAAADEALLKIYKDVAGGKQLALAGSGVGHFDSRYLKKFLPRSTKLLTHYVYDVGVVRRFLRNLAGVDISAADPQGASSGDAKTHRALDDAWAHLYEAGVYVKALSQVTVE